MSRILLDTSAYSAFRRGEPALVAALQAADSISVNAIALGELRAGFAAGTRREANEEQLRSFLDSPRVHVLPVDEETSDYFAEIHVLLRRAGTPIPVNDLWIAATAMQHGLRLVTTDAHFRNVHQVIVDCLD